MLYISTSNLTDSEILSSIERAISRNVRVYMLIDSTNFQSFIDYEGSKGKGAHTYARAKEPRLRYSSSGLEVSIKKRYPAQQSIRWNPKRFKWKLVYGFRSKSSRCIENSYGTRVLECRRRKELLSPTSNPEAINSAPYTLKKLENNDLILRSFYSLEGEENILKSSLINGLEWKYLSKGKSSKNSIVLEGKEVILGDGCENILQCNTETDSFDSNISAHSGFSVLVAIGDSSFISGWDRDALGDWYSLMKLNSSQEKTLISLIQQYTNNPEWIGYSKIKLGEAETESFVTELRWKFLILRLKT